MSSTPTSTAAFAGSSSEEYELEVLSGWHIRLDHVEELLGGGTIDWPNWSEAHKPDWDRIRAGYEARAV